MATISCHYVNAALGGLTRHGYNPESLLIKAGINPKLVRTPVARVSDAQMTLLVQVIWDAMADEFMGFTRTPCKKGTFALMTQSVRRCENLREVMQMGTKFYNLFTDDIHTELSESETEARISIKFASPELDQDHFYHEFWLIIWHRFASWIIGKRIPLVQTCLAYPKPNHAAELHYLFPGPHSFENDENQLAFDNQYLNLPPIRSKADLASFLVHSPADLMTIPGDDNNLQNKITRLITAQSAIQHKEGLSFPSIDQLANQLYLTPQTLHRRLKREGTSYQRIKDSIRRDVALTKLVKERLPVKQVAEIVGFSEPRSFTRAFKHWTGLSPREYCKFV